MSDEIKNEGSTVSAPEETTPVVGMENEASKDKDETPAETPAPEVM
jgi:hypothetical protein